MKTEALKNCDWFAHTSNSLVFAAPAAAAAWSEIVLLLPSFGSILLSDRVQARLLSLSEGEDLSLSEGEGFQNGERPLAHCLARSEHRCNRKWTLD